MTWKVQATVKLAARANTGLYGFLEL